MNSQVLAHKVFALQYARHSSRKSNENFIGEDPHDGSPMPFSFFFWVIQTGKRVYLVDTGFDEERARVRNREFIKDPIALLEEMGIKSNDVTDIIVTHMHYDHAGNIGKFPNAKIHIQETEISYCTGPCMIHRQLRGPFEAVDVNNAVNKIYSDQVNFISGDSEIEPGITVHLVGGHTAGLQVVKIETERGPIVLASDAAHYWENITTRKAFPIVFHVAQMLAAHLRILKLTNGELFSVIPGHDPLVLSKFPQVNNNQNIIALHEKPMQHSTLL